MEELSMDESDNKSQTALEKARVAVQREREKQQSANIRRAIFIAIPTLVIASFLHNILRDPPEPDLPKKCTKSDVHCISNRLLPEAYNSCTESLAQQLKFIPTWTDDLTHPRFTPNGWHEPFKSVIFIGRQIEVSNAFGAKRQFQYFCVVSAHTGQVLQSGFPDIQE